MNNLKLGQHIKVSRVFYTHHGIYIGDNQVIHYSGFAEAFKKGCIELTTLEDFLGGYDYFSAINYPSDQQIYSPDEVISRALNCLGEDDYNLLFNNCEHFACWCVTGEKRSEQVQAVMQQACTALVSYSLLRTGTVVTATIPIATTTTVSTTALGSSLFTNAAIGGFLGAGTATVATGALTTTGTALGTAALGATAVVAAPVILTAGLATAVVGGLFSFFND
ncbi:lecithin retinol acyltransferase family protein [Acinetobacter bereziniae]|uniref:LRAT domain-containing protein n=1 Tax=Acinetobacter bereziniae NIPH 3 TaxID=1217651 RepID=N8YX35_ACIBZ|nr:lecithin retinol acyltransferase family protein [Acinetobacter bereziniae]ENV23815.1 hypothetical protein F963_00122 [Acinetobacter bereziniae NIPH 3]